MGNKAYFFCRYKLAGTGSDLFNINEVTGVVTVAECTGDISPCLDYEATQAYFLTLTATDNGGTGKSSVVNLRITVSDANDNPPVFVQKEYTATIDEGETLFNPVLVVKATDQDVTSLLKYTIVDGNVKNLFTLDRWVITDHLSAIVKQCQ